MIFILFFWSNFINRPSILFLGGDVALVHKYLHTRYVDLGTRLIPGTYVLIRVLGVLFFLGGGMLPWFISIDIPGIRILGAGSYQVHTS